MAKMKTQFSNAVRSFSLTFTFMAILTLGSMYSIGNPDQVFPYLPTLIMQQEAKPVMNRNNFNHHTFSLNPLCDDTKNKFQESSLHVPPELKAVKSKQKIGNGKKLDKKILCGVLVSILLVGAIITNVSIPVEVKLSSSLFIPVAIGLGILLLTLFLLKKASLDKLNPTQKIKGRLDVNR